MTKNGLYITLFLLLCFSLSVEAQDVKKNKKIFNITKFSYIDPKNALLEESIEGEGVFATDLNVENAQAYSLQTITGYFISPLFSVGIGFGLDGYHEPTFNTAPLFIDARFYFQNRRNTPMLFVDYGTLVKLGEEFEKGTMVEAGAGYKFFISDKLAMLASINFSAKGISLTDESFTTSDETVTIRGIGFTLGFIF
jgi:hypothetical protein